MARPFTASDDDSLRATATVMARSGPDAFALAEVAKEVGLSRAAIILQFKSTHDLKVTLLTKLVERFAAALETLPQSPGGDNLLRIAAFIGTHVHSHENGAKFFANYFSSNVRHRDLLDLEVRRGEALGRAISKVMPEGAIDHDSAVIAFRSHRTGSIVAGLSRDDTDSRRYLVSRTQDWLKLVGIAFSEQLADELSASRSDSVSTKKAGSKVSSLENCTHSQTRRTCLSASMPDMQRKIGGQGE